MKRKILIAFIIYTHIIFSQCMIVPVPLKDLIHHSDVVVEGKLLFKECKKGENGHIYSYYSLNIYKNFKGISMNSLIIKSFGGQLNLEMSISNPSDELEEKHGIFFLKKNELFYELTATNQGKIWIENQEIFEVFNRYSNYFELTNLIKEITHQEIIINEKESNFHHNKRLAPIITSISPNRLTAGTDSILTIKGSNFNSTRGSGYVEFSNANTGGGGSYVQPFASQYDYWDDTMIRVKLRTTSGTGNFRVTNSDPITTTSSFNLNVPFNITNVTFDPGSGNVHYIPRLQGLNSTNAVIFSYNTRFFDSTNARIDFKRALEKWRCTTLVNFDTSSTNTSVDVTSSNGIHVVAWDFNNTLSLGVLGTAFTYYSGCFVSGNYNWLASDLDIIFNDVPYTSFTWEYGTGIPSSSQYDFESVALHELGHSHQLGHVIASSQTMHYSIANGQRKNTLSTNDSLGGLFIVNRSTSSICGQNSMNILSNSNCSYTALPIDEIVLKVSKLKNNYYLNWNVYNEINIVKYIVQISYNGIQFFNINEIKSSDNYDFIKTYSMIDNKTHFNTKTIIYRIAAIDQDSKIFYSNSYEIDHDKIISNLFYIKNSELNHIQSYISLNEIKNVEIYNLLGQKIPFNLIEQSLFIENQYKGILFINFEYHNEIYVQKILLN